MKFIAVEFLHFTSAYAFSEVQPPYSNASFINPFAMRSGADARSRVKIAVDTVEYTLVVNDQAILNFSVP